MTRYVLLLIAGIGIITTMLPAQAAGASDSRVETLPAERQIELLMASWIGAVAEKKADDLIPLVDSQSESYYLRIKELALSGEAGELAALSEVDQLQVMFFRLMIEQEQLRRMTARQLLAFAVEKGFIGMELRHADLLGEIRVTGDTATGRLFKFGKSDRPDRYLQHFVKEQGVWQGEEGSTTQ